MVQENIKSFSEYDFVNKIRSGELDVVSWLAEQDEESIRERIYQRVDDGLDVSEGSYLYDSLEPSNVEFGVAYFMLHNVILLAFPQYAFGEWLTLAAAARGVTRNGARNAIGYLTIKAEVGTIIPAGSKFSNTIPAGSDIEPKYYSSLEQIVVGATGESRVHIRADTPGAAGNASAGEINLNVQDIKKITSVENKEPLVNGVDEESDESLLERLLEKVRNPPSSGNRKDYVRWAKEVSGVMDAVCIPLWDGPGTVKVVIMGKGGEAIPELIQEVKEYLDPSDHEGEGEGCAPIGAVVTVGTIEPYPVKIRIDGLAMASGYELDVVKLGIEKAVIKYVADVGIGETVRLRYIEDAIKHVPGVYDFGKVFINDQDANVAVPVNLKPVVLTGGVTFDEG